jgi:hypothetical protein
MGKRISFRSAKTPVRSRGGKQTVVGAVVLCKYSTKNEVGKLETNLISKSIKLRRHFGIPAHVVNRKKNGSARRTATVDCHTRRALRMNGVAREGLLKRNRKTGDTVCACLDFTLSY